MQEMTLCSTPSFSAAAASSAHMRSDTGRPDLMAQTCMCTSLSVLIVTCFGENALDNVSATTRSFPGVYSSFRCHISECVAEVSAIFCGASRRCFLDIAIRGQ